ncbi:WlaTC/HtrL family glycosyltransferase [Pelosinus sp. IPA-1]|uniref:WlaTC/HtrL family glycosyltransferase n=1 Tax=Pelosinus sp. IPA-1 TaxID=3029569 RepID=UPI00243617D8|nr:WlaTC/HtrL family glycosyltransferase [Pelosinus sp. IPA-1]GMB01270.1 protein HtrL [Pelosinus sp. IPA-1]
MSEITIVTAFFDIGRKGWKTYERSSNRYVEYFKFWARIKNKLIVYTDKITAEQVIKVRDEFHLKDRTQIIIIDDVYALEPEVYKEIQNALSNEAAINFRSYPKNPESWNSNYNYVTYLKPYFVADAVKKGYAAGMVAWVDFGYNHGGENCIYADEFDFLWCYDFSPKIHLFAMEQPDNMPIFEVVRTMRAYIAGAIMVAPAELWIDFARLYKESMLHLTHCGFADDDQTLSIMAYRERPELFEIHPVDDWFIALKDVGGAHLTRASKLQYKESKKQAKHFWQEGNYLDAIKWYNKYAREKLQAK